MTHIQEVCMGSTKGSGQQVESESAEPLSFEAALAQLESVVVRLERGELSLEESLSAYEDGVRLVQVAKNRVDGMQSRLEQLLHDGKSVPLTMPTSPDGKLT